MAYLDSSQKIFDDGGLPEIYIPENYGHFQCDWYTEGVKAIDGEKRILCGKKIQECHYLRENLQAAFHEGVKQVVISFSSTVFYSTFF
ncbi:hypothetical protein ACKUB1_00500 [Methanospirillum stamsii]|uniref:Uncharacterized protein n=1 Tax=Methanospirillum stamsii TaxID=1277351 RepID=A0A2V2N2J2_9EURY|nr:hypothetical protein [Methanospirillum stamsii]PWR69681.1 hypothetical protein DLD82_17145 [Methanospirillum stamsii]